MCDRIDINITERGTMKIKELKKIISKFDDNADVTIIDKDQNNCYKIIDFRTCEDNSSEYKNSYLDIVIE